jgi:hypothetical protein
MTFFWEEDARIILAIPVYGGMENLAAWYFDKKEFSRSKAHTSYIGRIR